MKISEQTQIEAQIGFLAGILIGAFSSWVFIIFFTPWQWYFKVGSSIGEVGIIGSLVLSLRQTILARKNYLDAQAEMAKISAESQKVIDTNLNLNTNNELKGGIT